MNSITRIKSLSLTRYILICASFLVTAVIFLSFIIPLFAVFFPSVFNSGLHFKQKNVDSLAVLKVTLFTLKIATGSTFVAVAIGLPAAFFCAKRKFIFKKILLGFSAIPLCVPVLIACLGFVSVFGISGVFNSVLEKFGFEKTKLLYSQWGIMLAQGFYNFPLVMSIVSRFWTNLSEENENASRLLGAGEGRVFFKIVLPSLLGPLASAVIPVFLFCYFSFMMVLLFSSPGTTTLEVEIYQAVKTSLDIKLASRLAVSETLSAIVILIVYILVLERQNVFSSTFEKNEIPFIGCKRFQKKGLRVLEICFFILLSVLILIFFIMPFMGIFISGFTGRIAGKDVFTLNQYKMLFKSKSFFSSIAGTMKVSFCTAFVCTIVSIVYALSLQNVENSLFRKVLETVSMLPMAVSSVVLGFGLTLVIKKGSVLNLVIIQSALFWPLAYRQINSSLQNIPKDVLNAASVLCENYPSVVFRVILPWIKKSIFASFGFCFAFSAGDTTLPLILSIQNFQTLSLYTYRLSGSYRFNTACASGTILALLCFIVFLISEKLGEKK